MMTTLKIKKGTVVFTEGHFSDTACIIETGTFEVTKKTPSGADKAIGILKKNDIFGEMGILDGLPRSATVTALEDSKVTVVTRDDFNSLSRKNPNALMPILKVMSMRLRRALKREVQIPTITLPVEDDTNTKCLPKDQPKVALQPVQAGAIMAQKIPTLIFPIR